MRFHVGEIMTPVENLLPLARAAEEYGYAGYTVSDSLFYPAASDTAYSYTAEGAREFLEDKPILECFVHCAAIAAATSRIEITTSVVKLPMRHPVVAAKLATSVAALSNNRFYFGVGMSVWPEDYAVLGLDYARRGRRLDECIDIVKGLAGGDYFEFHGEFYDFAPVKLNPVPSGPLPIIIGGHSDAALRRAARHEGWSCAGNLEAPVESYIRKIESWRRELGRSGEFRVFQHDNGLLTLDDVKRKQDAGITDVIMPMRNIYAFEPDTEPLQAKLDRFKRFADEVMQRL